mmetsp:Transcript_3509/g.3961  ORF Transcript_3509/g.3961 Transcript_3509/m.3961 type:complete len:251 (+) Transcript_3509:115-867(+)
MIRLIYINPIVFVAILRQLMLMLLMATTTTHCFVSVDRGFVRTTPVFPSSSPSSKNTAIYIASINSIEEASQILSEFDKLYNLESPTADIIKQHQHNKDDDDDDDDSLSINHNPLLAPSIRLLSYVAADDRNRDSTQGRCMLGICAASAEEGLVTLKAWVTALDLPRGLLHGMDKDGITLDINGAVYIKYNSGGVYTFTQIRKSGLGFDALWKPGDALLEPYDGPYRGVYFQVELNDGEFRQYMVPSDTF